jgi:hypothetical protein
MPTQDSVVGDCHLSPGVIDFSESLALRVRLFCFVRKVRSRQLFQRASFAWLAPALAQRARPRPCQFLSRMMGDARSMLMRARSARSAIVHRISLYEVMRPPYRSAGNQSKTISWQKQHGRRANSAAPPGLATVSDAQGLDARRCRVAFIRNT